VFKCEKSLEEKGYVLVEGVYSSSAPGTTMKVLIMNIYTPCSYKDKVLLWKDIEDKLASANCVTLLVVWFVTLTR